MTNEEGAAMEFNLNLTVVKEMTARNFLILARWRYKNKEIESEAGLKFIVRVREFVAANSVAEPRLVRFVSFYGIRSVFATRR